MGPSIQQMAQHVLHVRAVGDPRFLLFVIRMSHTCGMTPPEVIARTEEFARGDFSACTPCGEERETSAS